MEEPEVLQDSPHRRVVRVGDTVRRPMHPWSPTIHELLQHLAAVGFPHSPRVLGVDDEGREILTYLEGESGPDGWARVVDEDGLVAMARLLRSYHEAVRGFGDVAEGQVICHGDFGPWNLVWHGTTPIGILDWDYAWAAPPMHDVAYALEYVAPFRDDEECRRWLRYPEPPDRRRRIEIFASAYGLTSTDGLVEEVIGQQRLVHDRALRLAAEGREPQRTWLADGWFDETARRIEWSERNRHLFDL